MILSFYNKLILYIICTYKVPREVHVWTTSPVPTAGGRPIPWYYYRWSTGSRRYFASQRPLCSVSPGGLACRVPFPSSGTPDRSSVPGGLACFAPAPLAGIPGRPASTSATLYACPACAAVTMPSVRRTTEAAPSTSACTAAAAATATAVATNNLRLLLL